MNNNNKSIQYNMATTTQAIYDPEAAAIPLHDGTESIRDYDVILAMRKYGTKFAVSLADCFCAAGSANQLIIKLAFPDCWDAYASLAMDEINKNNQLK
tara:strand:+ start:241 stop:534 length:294 start_codon:yes stop_codon:yes gene_type:complete